MREFFEEQYTKWRLGKVQNDSRDLTIWEIMENELKTEEIVRQAMLEPHLKAKKDKERGSIEFRSKKKTFKSPEDWKPNNFRWSKDLKELFVS